MSKLPHDNDVYELIHADFNDGTSAMANNYSIDEIAIYNRRNPLLTVCQVLALVDKCAWLDACFDTDSLR